MGPSYFDRGQNPIDRPESRFEYRFQLRIFFHRPTHRLHRVWIVTPPAGILRIRIEILEAIFETDFIDNSYGFRPNRNCIQAIDKLDKEVMTYPNLDWIV